MVLTIFSPASAIYNSANVNLCSDCHLSLFDYEMAKVVIQNDAQITNMDLKNDAFSIEKG